MHAYHGRYLWVDLSTRRAEWRMLGEDVLRGYLGGSGLGTWLLLNAGAAAGDPLAPDAPLVFAFSPLVGSPLTTSAKFAVVSKSPLTGRINDSLASSGLALAGKRAGCDAIMIVGRAERPAVLVIDDGHVSLSDADELWGRTIEDAERALREVGPGAGGWGFEGIGAGGSGIGNNEVGVKGASTGAFSFAVIGPAGEKLVRFATISHDGRHAGRGGSGAVMGSKLLKAIAIRGTQRPTWAHSDELGAFAKELSERSFGPATAKYRELGTATNLLVFNRLGTLPTRNFQQGVFAGAERLSPESLVVERDRVRASCAACTIGCEHLYTLKPKPGANSDANAPPRQIRLEYENLFALGPLCGIDDPDVVLAASARCDALGLDTISTGGTIAFAMECVERGWLDVPWLRFGDGEALLRAIELIGHREGLGDRLAEGSRSLAASIGHDSIAFAPQVKGLEIPGYEPRALQMMALGFAVGTRGADHNRSGAYEVDFSDKVDRRHALPDDVAHAIETEDRAAVMDSLILCKFLRGVFSDFFAEAAEILRLTAGWDVSAGELQATARRIVAAKKVFNQRAGWTPAEDTLPERFLRERLPDDDRAVLSKERLAELVRAYNVARGWTAEGFVAERGFGAVS